MILRYSSRCSISWTTSKTASTTHRIGTATTPTVLSRLQLEVSSCTLIFQVEYLSNIYLALLDFDTPRGIRLNVSSLSSPNFATSYTLGSVGIVDGSLSYLYSSLPLNISSASGAIPLRHLIHGYRQLQELRPPDQPWWWEIWQEGKRVDRKG